MASNSVCENSRPRTAPICANSLASGMRSRRARSDACSEAGTASGPGFVPSTDAVSRTVLVNSSTNNGIPSACSTIRFSNAGGSVAPVVTLVANATACRRFRRGSVNVRIPSPPIRVRVSSLRVEMTRSAGISTSANITELKNSIELASAQCASSSTTSKALAASRATAGGQSAH